MTLCDHCEEQQAVLTTNVTTLDGELIEGESLCLDCAKSGVSSALSDAAVRMRVRLKMQS